jgi:hypothetical protein
MHLVSTACHDSSSTLMMAMDVFVNMDVMMHRNRTTPRHALLGRRQRRVDKLQARLQFHLRIVCRRRRQRMSGGRRGRPETSGQRNLLRLVGCGPAELRIRFPDKRSARSTLLRIARRRPIARPNDIAPVSGWGLTPRGSSLDLSKNPCVDKGL